MRRAVQSPPDGRLVDLTGADATALREVLALVDREPVANTVVAARIAASRLERWKLGGELWGYERDGRLEGLCYAGANLVPICAGPDAVRAFAERARRRGRRCTSIVGPHAPTAELWNRLEDAWGPAREVRAPQPLMVAAASGPRPGIAPDPAVRLVRADELDALMPAAVAMFTEEVGVSPTAGPDGGRLFRSRVGELVALGRAFARIEDGRVVFKAEVNAVTERVCQVQGVWVAPDRRGRGIAAPAMAAVVELARARLAPTVSLYVNEYNAPARAAYRSAGFREVGAMMTVLF
ncbi:GNAT family N-acetyltransferase [Mangrovactinospora gilvigrisea]|uniref:GNAT family N-acetyltransferase n=1 Tax=Mangrovactinospora gilvigrisea TaxID=1428644 RepID=A0A1J7B9Q7_9ACTN|nr:GNAT family N-acetyltransferase [Mangrovactinospora gilvigrisea]OIV35387.1 GNAT family N-acetyltransferase [Mangrovactinospora gilvigrisea]